MWSGQSADASTDAAINQDVFGQTAYLDNLAANVDINAALAETMRELSAIPPTETAALVQAQILNPQLLSDDSVLNFLWAENFSAPDAARRLVRYWTDRYKLFGPDKFCLPLTLKGALKDDGLALSRGYIQLLPETDTAGRAVIYIDWSCHEPSVGYSEDSMLRVFWYMIHVAMEDTNAARRGLVMMIYPQQARLDQFDHSLWNSMAECCKKSLPIRWRSTHIVHPNRFFSILHPIFMSNLPKDVQDRVVVHDGTKMKVLANLLRYCLPWERNPEDIGGCIDLDVEKWLAERSAKEDQALFQKQPSANPPSFLLGSVLQQGGDTVSTSTPAMGLLSCDVQSSQQPNDFLLPISHPFQSAVDGAAGGSNRTTNNNTDSKITVAKASSRFIIKSGRKSDPRMDRAVQLKLDNPSLSLLDALRAGGFVFPTTEDSGTPQYSVVDSDNVKITQRKNQLLRRIRTAKKRVEKSDF